LAETKAGPFNPAIESPGVQERCCGSTAFAPGDAIAIAKFGYSIGLKSSSMRLITKSALPSCDKNDGFAGQTVLSPRVHQWLDRSADGHCANLC